MENLQVRQNEIYTPRGINRLHSSLFLCGRSFLASPSPHLACFTHLTYLLEPLSPDQSKSFISFRRKGREAKWDAIRIWVIWLQIQWYFHRDWTVILYYWYGDKQMKISLIADRFRCSVPITHTLLTSWYLSVKFIIIYLLQYLEANYVAGI